MKKEEMLMDKSYWNEIKADHDELDGFEPEDDIIKSICVDAWKTDDDNEEGCVVAKVIFTKSGDVGVVYIDYIAKTNELAQEVIKEVLREIKP